MACTKAFELPSTSATGRLDLSFSYGMNEIRMILNITFVRRFDCGKPTHIYKKPDFSNDDSMGKKILLVLCNRLYITTSCAPSN